MKKKQTTKKSTKKAIDWDQLPEWPADKPLPAFKDEAGERAFYASHSFAATMETGEQFSYTPNATRFEGAGARLQAAPQQG